MKKKQLVIGFDGYIDRILKPIHKTSLTGATYFDTLHSFSSYLLNKSNNSCAIQADLIETRFGGNAPLLTKTLRNLVKDVTLIGMLGDLNKIDNVFVSSLGKGINYSFMDPVETQALEFSDAKLFLSVRPQKPPKNILKKILSMISDPSVFTTADVLVLVNWGELDFSHELWGQIYNKFIAQDILNKSQHIFIDTAALTRHSTKRILELCTLLVKLNLKRSVTLALNANELKTICKAIKVNDEIKLFNKLKVDTLVCHSKKQSQMFTQQGNYIVEVKQISSPVISTGAGDNFNAGYIYSILKNKSNIEKLKIANACSHYYMKKGFPVHNASELEKYMSFLYSS